MLPCTRRWSEQRCRWQRVRNSEIASLKDSKVWEQCCRDAASVRKPALCRDILAAATAEAPVGCVARGMKSPSCYICVWSSVDPIFEVLVC